ncbi:MAG TPA: ABC transporter substrate-binding protein [Chloroflexota bacterium]|nr:ABC transporter substrate-binding protein [Chloroflexota bacterium]
MRTPSAPCRAAPAWLGLLIATVLLTACAGSGAANAPTAAKPAASGAAPVAPPAPAAPAAAAPTPAAAPLPPEPARVVVGGLGGLIDRVFYIAQDKGFFREQGIEIDYNGVTSMVQAAPHLAAGQMDVISSSTSAGLWNAISRDVSVKAITDVTVVRPNQRNSLAVVVRKDLADQIHDYPDLRGHTFAIHQKAQINHVELARLLDLGGLTEQDINLVEVPFPDQVAALRNAAIDASIEVEPMVTVMEEQGIATRWRDMGEIYPGQVVQFLFYSAPFIRERRDVGVRYLIAHLKAARYFEDAFLRGRNRDEVVSILVENGPIKDPAMYDKIGRSFAGSEVNGRVSLESLADEQEFYLRNGFISTRIDPAQLVDTSFSEQALRVLGRVD